jgi:hypothetical protein
MPYMALRRQASRWKRLLMTLNKLVCVVEWQGGLVLSCGGKFIRCRFRLSEFTLRRLK